MGDVPGMLETFRPWLAGALIWVVGLPAASALATERQTLSIQQRTFLAAEHALKRGQRTHFHHLLADLRDYPLYPYLRYAELSRYISHTPAVDMQAFLREYAGTPLAWSLRRNWLENLARRHRWQAFVDHYQPDISTAMQCRYYYARLKLGQTAEAFEGARYLWLVGKSRPRACDPLFAAWRKAGLLTPALVWRRIELAMENNRLSLALYLARFLPMHEQKWVRIWRRVYRHPADILHIRQLQHDTIRTRQIVLHGLLRMAAGDADAAMRTWNTLQERHAFTESQVLKAESGIGLNLAIQAHPLALTWLAKPRLMNHTDHRLRAWRIRVAMRLGAWATAVAWIETLPARERHADVWQYWLARGLEMTGEKTRARRIYTALSQTRGYYGFLAADHISAPYRFANHPITLTPADRQSLQAVPAIQRARELFRLGRIAQARREWAYAASTMHANQLELAAKLAQEWGWHDRGIATAALARAWDDLELRFPIAYRQAVFDNAAKNGLDLSWVYAVIRQESAFTRDARSPAGALGLMQLMPATARRLAPHIGLRAQLRRKLLSPKTNIRLGTAYLRLMLDRMKANRVLATAAYNAGPNRVQRWLPYEGAMPADLWVETIPFNETRRYLQRVLAYTVIYEQRLGFMPSLRAHMQPVGTPAQVATRPGGREPS